MKRIETYLLVSTLFLGVLFTSNSSIADLSLLNPPAEPTVVKVGFYLSDINDVNEQQETFEFEGRLISRWKDARLAFDPLENGSDFITYTGSFQFSEIFAGWYPQFVLANKSGAFEQEAVVLRHYPDGTLHLIQEISAVVEMPMSLRRFPFDQQIFTAYFLVLGYTESQVQLEVDLDSTGRDDNGVQVAQWHLEDVNIQVDPLEPSLKGSVQPRYSRVAVQLDMRRRPQFMLRIVVFPLTLLCLLCASVFWMDHESLGDRMAISFTGLLSIVAYQFLIGGSLPTIAYFTLMDSFLYSTYMFIACSIVVNLRVDHLNRTGRQDAGDRLDEKCRWVFPSTFFGINLLIALIFFTTQS